MNEREDEMFEAELRRLKPARLPDELHARLDVPPFRTPQTFEPRRRSQAWRLGWQPWRRWLAPATAVLVATLFAVSQWDRGRQSAPPAPAAPAPTLKADQVEIDQELLGSFDAVANLPDGEPVRFRFQQWMDAVTVRDSARGVEVVQRIPRLEVVPVRFVTY